MNIVEQMIYAAATVAWLGDWSFRPTHVTLALAEIICLYGR